MSMAGHGPGEVVEQFRRENAALKAEVERLNALFAESDPVMYQAMQKDDEETARLRAEVERMTTERDDSRTMQLAWRLKAQDLESQVAALTTENAQLRAERDTMFHDLTNVIYRARGYANQTTSASEEPPR